jgi:internalin A
MNLADLDLSYNQLTELPESIKQLTNLTSFDLNNNQLTELPKAISYLVDLKYLDLECLSLEENPWTHLPPELLKQGGITS